MKTKTQLSTTVHSLLTYHLADKGSELTILLEKLLEMELSDWCLPRHSVSSFLSDIEVPDDVDYCKSLLAVFREAFTWTEDLTAKGSVGFLGSSTCWVPLSREEFSSARFNPQDEMLLSRIRVTYDDPNDGKTFVVDPAEVDLEPTSFVYEEPEVTVGDLELKGEVRRNFLSGHLTPQSEPVEKKSDLFAEVLEKVEDLRNEDLSVLRTFLKKRNSPGSHIHMVNVINAARFMALKQRLLEEVLVGTDELSESELTTLECLLDERL